MTLSILSLHYFFLRKKKERVRETPNRVAYRLEIKNATYYTSVKAEGKRLEN
jgi:hypothetical protein